MSELMESIAGILRRRVLFPLGMDLSLRNEDRRVLHETIFPYLLARTDLNRILFVGCEIYTHSYNRLFAKKEYHTIEPAPERAKYGSRRHVVDTMENMSRHYAPGSFDAIICNGVFGWGLNETSAAECALRAAAHCLRQQGLLVIGWDDVPQRRPFAPLELNALRAFEPFVLPPLGQSEYLTQTASRHTYNFFVKT